MDGSQLVAVDTHTLGEPTRIVIDGFPTINGRTMMEKKVLLQQDYDHLRRALMDEPRGHRDMFGAILLPPTNPAADIGVVFMDSGGYLNMCGHGSMGVATVAVARGLVARQEPFTDLVLETPAGLISTRVKVENGRVKEVSVTNVPSFLYRQNLDIEVPDWGTIACDIAFGGNFFALVNSDSLNLPFGPDSLDTFIEAGAAIRRAVNQQVSVCHPLKKDIRSVDLVEFYQEFPEQNAMRNVVIFGDHQVDRSPCGTGTSAKLAALCAKNNWLLGETLINEGIIGTQFTGRVLGHTQVGDIPAIIPEITGRAFITGENRFFFDEEDPFEYGFSLPTRRQRRVTREHHL
ncbi:MAG: proline racemase family protein [Sporolactobacillus sp.]